MTIRISLPRIIDANHGNYAHRRHFYEALLRVPSSVATVGIDLPDADLAFPGVGVQGTILHDYSDPHAMARDVDVRTLIRPEYMHLLPLAGYSERVFDGEQELRLSRNPICMADTVNARPEIKVAAFVMDDPLRGMIEPRLHRAKFMPIHYMPPEWIFHGAPEAPRPVDVYWRGAVSQYHPLRKLMVSWFHRNAKARGIAFKEEFYPPELYGMTIADFDEHHREFASRLREAKIVCFDGGVFAYPVSRYFEVMACGSLVMAPMPRDSELLGFRDGVNMVSITWETFEERLMYYLSHDDERIAIAAEGHRLARERNTCGPQAARIATELAGVVGK